MRVIQCVQGSPEWLLMRSGIPTASEFDKIVTPTGKLSKSSRDYKALLIAERVMQAPITRHISTWMDRGTQFEAEAVQFYEFQKETFTERIGFVTNDAGTIGASPDRWAGDDGQVEIKVPAPNTHMGYYLADKKIDHVREAIQRQLYVNEGLGRAGDYDQALDKELDEAVSCSLAREYKVQTAGQLWITERKWTDLLSYSPDGLPPVFVHLERDEAFIDILAQAVSEFSRDLEETAARLVADGVIVQEIAA